MKKQFISNSQAELHDACYGVFQEVNWPLVFERIVDNNKRREPLVKLKHSEEIPYSLIRHTFNNQATYFLLTKFYINDPEQNKLRLTFRIEFGEENINLTPRLFYIFQNYDQISLGANLYTQYFIASPLMVFTKQNSLHENVFSYQQDLPLLHSDFGTWLDTYYAEDAYSEEDVKIEKEDLNTWGAWFSSWLPSVAASGNKIIKFSDDKWLDLAFKVRKLLYICMSHMLAVKDFHTRSFLISLQNSSSCLVYANFVHRNIRPESLVYDDKNRFSYLKNFLYAIPINTNFVFKTRVVGDYFYLCPDALENPSYKSDYYALSAVIALTLGADVFSYKEQIQKKHDNARDFSLVLAKKMASAELNFELSHLKPILVREEELQKDSNNDYNKLLEQIKLLGKQQQEDRADSLKEVIEVFKQIQLNLLFKEIKLYLGEELANFFIEDFNRLLKSHNWQKLLSEPIGKILAIWLQDKEKYKCIGEEHIKNIKLAVVFDYKLSKMVLEYLPSECFLAKQILAQHFLKSTEIAVQGRANKQDLYPLPLDIIHEQVSEQQRSHFLQRIAKFKKDLLEEVKNLKESPFVDPNKAEKKIELIKQKILPAIDKFEPIAEEVIKEADKHVGIHGLVAKFLQCKTTVGPIVREYNLLIANKIRQNPYSSFRFSIAK